MSRSVRTAFIGAVAIVSAVGAWLYAFVAPAAPIAEASSMCTEADAPARSNPNEMLFISCGGFL